MKKHTPHKLAAARLVTVIAALVAGTAATGARASTISLGSYASLFQGVSEITATVDGHADAIVRVDLTAPGIGFTTTGPVVCFKTSLVSMAVAAPCSMSPTATVG